MNDAELLARITKILYDEDPVKISFCCNPDEYDLEASTIIKRLPLAKNGAYVLEIVHDEFSSWFGRDVAGSKRKYRAASALIWATWLQHTHT